MNCFELSMLIEYINNLDMTKADDTVTAIFLRNGLFFEYFS